MKLDTKTLCASVRIALSIGAAITVGLSGTAIAGAVGGPQDDAAQPTQSGESTQHPTSKEQKATLLQAVHVTGSHIARVDLETANPILTVNRQAIEATGDVTLGQLVQDLPVMTGSATNTSIDTGGGSGAVELSLRGLGPKRTLILVDGHRVISNDVDSIPAAMIDHIDVLTNGASAIYGSDAIGGVVNFITRKNYSGAQFTGDIGRSSHADADRRGYTFTFGHTFDKGSFIAGIGYNKTDGVEDSERSYSLNARSIVGSPTQPPTIQVGGSSYAPFGHIQIPRSGPVHDAFSGCASQFLARNPGASGLDSANDYHCFQNAGQNSDKYNFNATNLLLTPQERSNVFVNGSYSLTENISAYLDAFYNKTTSNSQVAPGIYIPDNISPDNYYNPFGVSFGGPSGYSFGVRMVALGNRAVEFGTTNAQLSTGLRGGLTVFGQDWHWDAGIDYGHINQNSTSTGSVSNASLYTGPSFLDPATGQVTCGTAASPISNCDGGFNPFNLNIPSSLSSLQAASVAPTNTSQTLERIARVDVDGGLFNLPAGTAQLALGLRYRQDHVNDRVDPILQLNPKTGTCILGGNSCASSMAGGFNVKEAYGEMFIPILEEVPYAYGLNMTIGDRYSRFSTVGGTNNAEIKVEWRPVQTLLLRGSVAQVFRAPDITEVFAPASGGSVNISRDPCDGYTGSPVNPACVNVPTDGNFRNTNVAQVLQQQVTTSGAQFAGFPLKPESGKSFDIGAVYSPSWVPGLTVSVDAWHLYLDDLISPIGLQSELDLCSAGQAVYCQFIHRFPSGPNQGQLSPQTITPTGNLGSLATGGLDLFAGYKLDAGDIGRFNVTMNATYLKYWNVQTAPGELGNVTFHDAGHFLNNGSAAASACPGTNPVTNTCLFPRLRANTAVLWSLGNWSASWRVRYIGPFRMGSPSPSQDTHPAGGALDGYFIDYGGYVYNDVAVGYTIPKLRSRVDFGVNNLMNKRPPFFGVENGSNANTDPTNFDLIGRYYWARLTVRF